jgi:hypothetical protein
LEQDPTTFHTVEELGSFGKDEGILACDRQWRTTFHTVEELGSFDKLRNSFRRDNFGRVVE